ncbi:rRNA maturation RNase YbeY [Candidatus Uhrbacteria bacterium]|nr:rRNA maturation RNase YbeY [Candidatus Uhrbacteria bacterium]
MRTRRGRSRNNFLRFSAFIPRATSIRRTVLKAVPKVPFERIAREVLGPRYDLSLVLCGDALARRLNAQYRKKNYCSNVLSFPLAPTEGEIFLNTRAAAREARKFRVPLRARLTLLFIHGCLHLRGLRHGKEMEDRESKVLSQFT